MKPDIGNIDEKIRQHLPSAPQREMESHIDHLFDRLQSVPIQIGEEPTARLTRRWYFPAVAAITASVTLAIFLPSRILQSAPAVLEDAAGMRKIHYGEVVRPSGDMSAMLSMTDGPRVETRSMSEFSLERTGDGGTRIHLNSGDLIIDAAGQHRGTVSVQTKDMMASVSGAVSLIKAGPQGSRVAAIGGEVRVQQGATEKRLRAGEQAATNPKMEKISITEDVAWSREAGTHVAQLQQSAVAGTEERSAFEVVSIRPTPPADTTGGRGAGPLPGAPCTGNVNVDPSRFVVTNVTLYRLITLAYGTPGRECTYYSRTDLLSGGPVWITMDRFDVQAVIPPGAASYTKEQVQNGEAPRLQAMLRTLLADRSRLAVRREMKEVSGYALKLGATKDAAQLSESGTKTLRESLINYTGVGPQDAFVGVAPIYKAPSERPAAGDRSSGRVIFGRNESLQDFAQRLASLAGRPVVNQTGLTGKFSYEVVFDIDHDSLPGTQALTRPLNDGSISALRRALEQQLGLKLESTRSTVETLVIEQVEKPSEN